MWTKESIVQLARNEFRVPKSSIKFQGRTIRRSLPSYKKRRRKERMLDVTAATQDVAANGTPVGATISYVLDQDLENLLRAIFNVKATESHEVLEALEHDHMTTWKRFIKLDDRDINELSKHARNNPLNLRRN